jgi:hypothetical protein
MKFCNLLCLYFHFSFVLSSSDSHLFSGFGLMKTYHRYIADQKWKYRSDFVEYAIQYHKGFPLKSLGLLEQYLCDRVFAVLFCLAIWRPYLCLYQSPTALTRYTYRDVLILIFDGIKGAFKNCRCTDEVTFKCVMEEIFLLIKLFERISKEADSQNTNELVLNGPNEAIPIFKFLIRNVSIDFTINTIDYNSLFRTLSEIVVTIRNGPPSEKPSLRLSKLYSLLWFYLLIIYKKDCHVIFNMNHHHKILAMYLILEQSAYLVEDFNDKGFYPDSLRLQLEELSNSESSKLDAIAKLLRKYDLHSFCKLIRAPKITSSFFELTHFIDNCSREISPFRTWQIMALAEFELCLRRKVL